MRLKFGKTQYHGENMGIFGMHMYIKLKLGKTPYVLEILINHTVLFKILLAGTLPDGTIKY